MSKHTLIAVAGSAFVASLAVAPIAAAAENPFALSGLSSGYQVADHQGAAPMEGKCGGMKAGEGKCGMSMADTNKDGKVSREEATAHQNVMFGKADANKDGSIDQDEMNKMREGMCGGMKCKAMEGKCGGMK